MLKKIHSVSIDYLESVLKYDPETGVLTWKDRPESAFSCRRAWAAWRSRFYGLPAGTSMTKNGYKQIRINKQTYLVHRVVWALFYKTWPAAEVDHINRDKLDNRITNLRDATHSTNVRNRAKANSNNSLGLMGVRWHRSMRKYEARAVIEGKLLHIGFFDDPVLANSEYMKAKDLSLLELQNKFIAEDRA